MNNGEVNQDENSAQGILLFIVYLICLWAATAFLLLLGGIIALGAGGYSATWVIAGLTSLGWGWVTWMGLKLPYDLFSDATTKAKRLLTVIYLVVALPQLATLLFAFLLYWENTKN